MRKKITSLLTLLLMAVSVMAQVPMAADKLYKLTSQGRGSWCVVSNQLKGTNQNDVSATDDQCTFALVEDEGSYYLWNESAQGFSNASGAFGTILDATPIQWTATNGVKAGTYRFYFDGSKNINLGGSKQIVIDGWNTADDGNAMDIVEVADLDLAAVQALIAAQKAVVRTNITWNVKDGNGNIVKSVTKEGCVKGQTYTSDIAAGFVTLTGQTSVVAGDENQTIDLTYTIAGDAPFQYSASFADAKWYTLTIRSTKYPTYDATSKTVKNQTTAPESTTRNNIFAFVGNPFDLCIVNGAMGEGKAFGGGVGANISPVDETSATHYQFENNSNHFVFARLDNTVAHINDVNGTLGYWNYSASATDGGSSFTFAEVDAETVAAIFANFDADYVAAKSEAATKIANLANLPVLYSPADIAAASAAIDATSCDPSNETSCNAALAAVKAAMETLYAAAHGKKFTLQTTQSSKPYVYAAETSLDAVTANSTLKAEAVYEVVYAGNGQYKLKAVKNELYVMGNANPQTASGLTDSASDAALFYVGNFNGTENNAYFAKQLSGYNALHWNSSYKGANCVWTYDAGASQWLLTSISDEDYDALLNALDWAAFETLVNELQAVTIGGGLGQYTTGDPMMDAYAPNYIEEFASYLDDKENTDAEDFEYAMEAMQGIKENMTLNLPQAGMFVTIKGKTSGKYIHNDGTTGAMITLGEDADATTIWYVGEGNKLVNYNSGLYMAAATQVAVGGAADTYTFSAGSTAGCYYVKPSSKNYLIDWTDGKANYWSNPATAPDGRCNWAIEEVEALPVAISAAGYATLYAPVALTVPAGVTAYVLTVNGEYLTATEVTTIPANTGVVLAGDEGTYSFEITTGGDAASCLSGTVATVAAPEGCYTLANGEDGIGFYSYAGTNVKGFKAYFESNVVADAKGFAISFGEADAIMAVKAAQAGNVYDLNGRKVVKAQKGIFIQNGKKVVK